MTTGLLLLAAVMTTSPAPDYTRLVLVDDRGTVSDLPLENTEASITVEGPLQMVRVRQVYGNPYDRPIEAVYVFPLPHEGSVYRMDMEVGDRHIRGEIRERQEAVRIYEEAISGGRTAALLEQERPNVFTQTVGNIMPGDRIVIEISYAAPVKYNNGSWQVVFPMVVGPRYTPRGVDDAHRVTPPIVPEGTRSGYDIQLSMDINPGFAVSGFESENHGVRTRFGNGNRLIVSLSREREIPNRDFVFSYTTARSEINAGLLSHNGELGGHFMLMLEPEAVLDQRRITPREVFIVIDTSGSMGEQPMEVARETARQFLAGLNPDDTFKIIEFNSVIREMTEAPLANTPLNIQAGIEFANALRAGGGTEMMGAVRAAVGYPEDPERARHIIFITDALVSNEREVMAELRATLGENMRLFSVGVGSGVSRFLVEGLAEEGRGYPVFVGIHQDPASAVADIFNKINSPLLVNIEIDWGRLDVTDVYPGTVRDLFAGEPLVVTGRYRRPGSGTVTIRGTIAGKPWERTLDVRLVPGEGAPAVERLWAGSRIHHLNRQLLEAAYAGSDQSQLKEQIIGTSLDYSVLSEHTAFVAVDTRVRADGGEPETVVIPVNMPEGITYEGIYGPSPQYHSRTIAPSVAYNGAATGMGRGGLTMTAMEEVYLDVVYAPSHAATLGGVSDYLGVRPTEFRAVILEALDRLNENPETLQPGTIRLRLSVNAVGRITSVDVDEDTVAVSEVTNLLKRLLMNKTIPGASPGTVTVTINIR